jgi:hypothetical protein
MRQLELEAADLAAQLGAGEALVAGIRVRFGAPSPEQIARWDRSPHRIV